MQRMDVEARSGMAGTAEGLKDSYAAAAEGLPAHYQQTSKTP